MEDHAADFFLFVVDVRNQSSMHRTRPVYDVIICAWVRIKTVPENAVSQDLQWSTKDSSMHNLSEI